MTKTREEYNAYMREYNKRRYHRLRGELIEQLGGSCVKCGAIDKLELDHIDCKIKSFDIGKCINHSYITVGNEASKLQLLCSTCHSIKSVEECGKTPTKGTLLHGSLSSYRYCKCYVCKLAKALYYKYHKTIPQNIIKDLFPV